VENKGEGTIEGEGRGEASGFLGGWGVLWRGGSGGWESEKGRGKKTTFNLGGGVVELMLGRGLGVSWKLHFFRWAERKKNGATLFGG